MKKTLLLGIDGLDYNLLMKWKEDLPNFKKLLERSCHGVLESTIPPITIPAWPSMFTGKREAGVRTIHMRKLNEDKELKIVRPTWLEDAFWRRMEEGGMRPCLYRVPGTTLGGTKNGFLVGGMPYGHETNDEEELNRLQSDLDIKEITGDMSDKEKVRRMLINLKEREKLLKRMIREDKYGFYFFVFKYVDSCLHRINSKEKLKEVYMEMDKTLGEIVKVLDLKNWDLIIASDHGGDEYNQIFYTNTWLRKNGFLHLKSTAKAQGWLFRIADFLIKLGFKRILKKIFVSLGEKLGVDTTFPYEKIDWEKTRAFSFSPLGNEYGGIFITRKEKEKIKKKIREKLPKDLIEVYEGEKIYGDKDKDFLPDLVIKGKNGVSISTRNVSKITTKRKSFTHTLKGSFIATGDGFKKDYKLENQKIWNIAPLILFLNDQSIPKYMKREINKEMFKENSALSKRKVQYGLDFEETKGLEI